MKFGLDTEKIITHLMLKQKHELIDKLAQTNKEGNVRTDRFEAKVTINDIEIDFNIFELWMMDVYDKTIQEAKNEFKDLDAEVGRRLEKRLKEEAKPLIDKMDDLRYKLEDIESVLIPYWERKK